MWRKNLHLLRNQRFTNIIQVLIPLIGLLQIYSSDMSSLHSKSKQDFVSVSIPKILNINYAAFDDLGGYLNVDSCHLWFLQQVE